MNGNCIMKRPSIDTEGPTSIKETILSEFCLTASCDVLRIQETYRGIRHNRPKIHGTQIAAEIPDDKYVSVIFVESGTNLLLIDTESHDIVEITMELSSNCTVTSLYKSHNQLRPMEITKTVL